MEPRLSDLNSRCKICGGLVPYWWDSCMKCGTLAHPPWRLRMWGGVYLVIGLLLCVSMGYLMVLIGDIIRHSGDPTAATRFNGTPAQAMGIFAVLWGVMLVGLTGVVMGLWQIRYGRRNLKLVKIAMGWYILLWVVYLASQLEHLWRLVRFG
ncbi:MAG: hypothetical protein ACO1SX_26815 [Actinomycetota bacterium]